VTLDASVVTEAPCTAFLPVMTTDCVWSTDVEPDLLPAPAEPEAVTALALEVEIVPLAAFWPVAETADAYDSGDAAPDEDLTAAMTTALDFESDVVPDAAFLPVTGRVLTFEETAAPDTACTPDTTTALACGAAAVLYAALTPDTTVALV
jgi:hypothetical protein